MITKNVGLKKLDRERRKTSPRKTKISKKKMKASCEGVWGKDLSLIEKRNNKCIVSFPTWYYAQGNIDGDLGLIAVMMLKGIYYTDVNIENPDEVIYEFEKKHAKKMQAIERAYFARRIKIDAKALSEVTTFLANYLLPSGTKHNFSGKAMNNPNKIN